MDLLTLMTILQTIMTAGEWCINGEIAAADALHQTLPDYTDAEQSDLRYLQQHVYAIIGGSSTSRVPAVRIAPPLAKNVPIPRQSRWSDGFFHDRSNVKKLAARRRVTNRPKDTVANVTRNGTADDDESGPAGKSTGTRVLFSDEQECVSANGGRACVCFMSDFLDLVGQRLDEATDGDDDHGTAAVEFRCQSFKAVPVAFNLYPPPAAVVGMTGVSAKVAGAASDTRDPEVIVERNGDRSGTRAYSRASRARSCGTRTLSRASRVLGHHGADGDKSEVTTVSWKEVDFDDIVNYRLEKPKDDHHAVQYCLVGSDAKVKCLINGNGTKINAFKWNFKKSKYKTNSTVTGTDTNILLILGLDPADSNNYTCTPTTDVVGDSKNHTSYSHYVLAVDKAIYEIRGSAFYKTRGGGGCTPEISIPLQKQLPMSVRTELCPEGSLRYACNVIVEKPKCSEDERTMEIKYVVSLNDKANYLTRIRTSKNGRIALRYQKILARISNVLASNLNKTLTVQITSKLSLIDVHFEPDYSRTNIKKFVSCSPGFGVREVFCAACPPHHYSPDKSTECLKCVKGFHQPVAGSDKCVKCQNMFASGCYMREVKPNLYYWMAFICVIVVLLVAIPCAFCCRDEKGQNNSSINKLKKIGKKFRKKIKRQPKIPFNNIHEKFSQRIQVADHISEETAETKADSTKRPPTEL